MSISTLSIWLSWLYCQQSAEYLWASSISCALCYCEFVCLTMSKGALSILLLLILYSSATLLATAAAYATFVSTTLSCLTCLLCCYGSISAIWLSATSTSTSISTVSITVHPSVSTLPYYFLSITIIISIFCSATRSGLSSTTLLSPLTALSTCPLPLLSSACCSTTTALSSTSSPLTSHSATTSTPPSSEFASTGSTPCPANSPTHLF